MNWFEQLRTVLKDYYPAGNSPDIVGYLRGSKDPNVWRGMRTGQMIVLGSVPPTNAEWAAAGVAGRGEVQTIRLEDMRMFLITYGASC